MSQLVPEVIRILHVFASLDRGGAEGMIMSLYRSVDRSLVQFDFVVNERDGFYAHEAEIKALGGRVYYMPEFKGLNSLSYYKSWSKLFYEHPEWNVVHAHHTSPAFIYLSAAKNRGRITIAHSHIANYQRNIKSLVKVGTRYPLRYISDYLFSCSKAAAQWMFGKQSSKTFLLNNSVDAKKLRFSTLDRSFKRKEIGLGDKLVVGHIGRFAAQKNHEFLIDIFCCLKELRPDSVLLLIGDGSLKKKIENKVRELGLSEDVVFLGVRSDIIELLSAIDVFLFPSLYEGLPVSMIEAQANGLPCVVSNSITSESKITDCVKFLPLSNSPEDWAKVVIAEGECEQRRDTYDDLVDAGYDIESNVSWLEHFYIESAKRARPSA